MTTSGTNIIRKEVHSEDDVCEVLFDINTNNDRITDLTLNEIKHIRNSILTFVQEATEKGGHK